MKSKQTFAAKAKAIIGETGWGKLAKALFESDETTTEETTEQTTEESEVQMAEAVLADGTAIVYDRLEEGGKVMVVTESGEMPAPDGDHALVDGTVISTVGGLITAVAAAAAVEGAEEVVEVESAASMDMAAIEKMMDEKVSALYEKMTTKMSEETVDKEKEEIKEEMRAIKEAFGAAMDIIEHLMTEQKDAPAGEVSAQSFNAKEQRKARFASARELAAKVKTQIIEEQKNKSNGN